MRTHRFAVKTIDVALNRGFSEIVAALAEDSTRFAVWRTK